MLGKTVGELLFGPYPLSGLEFSYWIAFSNLRQEEMEAENKK